MKKSIFLLLLLLPTMVFGRGLRHSVCQITPEYSEQELSDLREMALLLSRSGKNNEAHFIQTITRPNYYGSGVVVAADQPCILTTYYAVGYAKTVTITIYLHDKTLRYRGCTVLGTDTLSNLALIALPESKDLDPLPIVETPIEDGDDIASAGYSTLGENASWQLVKGTVSNAYLRRDGNSYIQHTAPINVGMAGGPLLQKTDSGYVVVGVNIGKIGSRDEVAMAVPVDQIRQTLTTDSLLSGAQWMRLQYDRIEANTYEGKKKAEEKERLSKRETVRGITNDVPLVRQNFFYHNYLSAKNMEAGFGMEFALDKRRISFLGMQFAASWTEARPISEFPTYTSYYSGYYTLYDPRGVFSPLFGLYLGAQIPLRVGNKHLLVPRLSQGGNLGPCVNRYYEYDNKYSVGTLMITSDSRLGLEYHYQLEKIDLIFALEYTAHIYATDAQVCWTYKNNAKPEHPIDGQTKLLHINENKKHIHYTCLNHGLGVRFAIGFGH